MANPAEYEPIYSDLAAGFILALPKRQARRALELCRTLARNPFLTSDYVVPDASSRPVEHLLVGGLILSYYVDHAAKQVLICEIEMPA